MEQYTDSKLFRLDGIKMVKVIDDSPENFFTDIAQKKLFLFGAGKRAKYICEIYDLKNIEAIIDNNIELCGSIFEYNNNCVPIINIQCFIELVEKYSVEEIVLLITPAYSSLSIIEQLDTIPALENLRCYLGRLLDDYYKKKEFDFSVGVVQIPKKIHYCWFGDKTIPEHLQYYINTWRRYCPNYEIIKWDESNYDVKKNQYMKEAYECQKWGFVPDYARLDIIYSEGGIYLDTDVELISSLDKLLNDTMYCGFNSYGLINLGLGFGATPKNSFVEELRNAYEGISFYNEDESENLTACSWYQHPIFKKYGFEINNEYQKKNNVVVYPSEVLAPTGASGCANNFTDKTISIHHAELSWISKKEKAEFRRFQENIKKRL